MLKKTLRLSHRDFIIAKSHGKTYKFPNFSAVILFHSSTLPLSRSRFSVVTSAKLDKRAVVRNKLRRQTYSILSASPLSLGADIIIFPYKSMLDLTHAEISSCLNSLLSKLTPSHP